MSEMKLAVFERGLKIKDHVLKLTVPTEPFLA